MADNGETIVITPEGTIFLKLEETIYLEYLNIEELKAKSKFSRQS